MKAYVDFIGCEKRKLDAQRVIDYLVSNEQEITPLDDADLVVMVTCGFSTEFEDACVERLDQIRSQMKEGARLVIGGCLPSINMGRLASLGDFDTFSPTDLDELNLVPGKVPMSTIPDPNRTIFDTRDWVRVHGEERTAAHQAYEKSKEGFKLRINWGCLGNCSYCVIKQATGKLRSKPTNKIMEEFEIGIKAGERTAFVTGGDPGAWGLDWGDNITVLLLELMKVKGDFQLFFHDFNIHWLIRYQNDLIPLIRKHQKKFGGLCIPVQSGSNNVLRAMRRPYTAEEARRTLVRMKKEAPAVQLGTHLIVGFPGESEDDFNATLDFIRDVDLDFLMCYKYSDNSLAHAFNLSDKVPQYEIARRHEIVMTTFKEKIGS